jgi:hypothetical protein
VLTAGVAEPAVDSVALASPCAGSTGGAVAVNAIEDRDDASRKGTAAKQSAQTLVDKFHADERSSRATGILPVRISFPAFGSSLYLVSQLTSENQAPSAEFSYQQDKKAGGK